MIRKLLPPWTYGFLASGLMLAGIGFLSGAGSVGPTLTAALAFGAISVLVGTGQMFVITSGGGNLDLSVAAVLTLAAYVAMTVCDRTGALWPGVLAALATGIAAGLLNFAAIRFLRLPPIIATLAWSLIFQSFAYNLGGEATLKPPAALTAFTTARLGPLQAMAGAVLVVTMLAAFALARTVWGRQLLALGQNERAAHFAGIATGPVRLWAYVICGATSALAGVLLSGFTGGAALNMGSTYLMESIAIVALGGTSVAGGQANAWGIWGAALFFNLMGTMLNISHAGAGLRFMVMGLLIVAIVAVVPRPQAR